MSIFYQLAYILAVALMIGFAALIFFRRPLEHVVQAFTALVLAIAYMQEKRYSEAISLLAPKADRPGFSYDARYYLGLCYYALKRDQEAEEMLGDLMRSSERVTFISVQFA